MSVPPDCGLVVLELQGRHEVRVAPQLRHELLVLNQDNIWGVEGIYRVTALNVTGIWIELAVWAAIVSTAQFSLSGSHLMASPGMYFILKQIKRGCVK